MPIAADESNIAPAVDVENLQLTDDVLANLTDLELSNISLFYFDNDSKSEKRSHAAAQCKVVPGDDGYPSGIAWKVLDLLSGGGLISTVPLGSACYDGEHYDEAKCQFLVNTWNDSDTQ